MSDFAREASAVNGKEFDGTNAENLTKAFNQIYSSITSSAKIKVFSITDTLSKWVDPVDFAGMAAGTNITRYVTVKNGNKMLTGGYTATYGVDQFGNRTVTVTFNGNDGIVAEKATASTYPSRSSQAMPPMPLMPATSNTRMWESRILAPHLRASRDSIPMWTRD